MKTILIFLFTIISSAATVAQDFSNKGKDFWVGYGNHCQMFSGTGTDATNGGTQEMVLYFTSDITANVTVTIPSTGWTRNYVVPANTVVESVPIPKTGADDVRLRTEGKSKKAIHITSNQPIVAYAHIYNGSISGATLLFPTNTLGKEYYSLNYTQTTNQAYSYPFCFAIATEDSTILEVTPAAATQTHAAGITFRDTLMKGEVLNLLGQITSTTGVDLTGTKIKSVASTTGQCKKIAVFSGSGKINIKCATGGSSADNLIQQVFPANAWGQKYFTVPTSNMPYNYFRVMVKDPTTVVKFNGAIQTGLVNGSFYNLPLTNQPGLIESDKPVLVAQYITTANTCGNTIIGGNGDPEMIYLSSIEQTIDKITLNSTSHSAITQHWINILIKTSAVPTFRIDGVPASSAFIPHPRDPSYSYTQISVSAGQHRLQADSGFNAIAYGYGSAESYGYNAGTNIRDLFNFITPINPLNISGQNTACAGTPFYFSITYPFQPGSLYWDFHGFQNSNFSDPSPVHDTTYLVNGKQVWRYKISTPYVYNTPGNYPVSITAGTSGSDGCGNLQTRDDTLYVFSPPATSIGWDHNGCLSDSVRFIDSTNYLPGTYSYKWYWDFGDGTTDNSRNPKHLYTNPGTYTVRLAITSNVGCLSDTATRQITLSLPPVAKFGISAPVCERKLISFSDSSTAMGSTTITKWYWDYGDGTFDTLNTGNTTHSYTSWGNKTVKLFVEINSGCRSAVASKSIYVGANPVPDFNLPATVCLPSDSARFIDASTIADGTQSGFTYLWNFGDPASAGNNISTLNNPSHYYNNTGPFTINLRVTSGAGCYSDTTKILSTVYLQAKANFSANSEYCLNDTSYFTSTSSGSGNIITNWFWDFGDGSPVNTTQNPVHTYAAANTYTVRHWVQTDKGCFSDTIARQIIINALPIAAFTNSSPLCETKTITFTSTSTANSGNLNLWKWDFGDGTLITVSNNNPVTHNYVATGNYTATLAVETDKGCKSNVFQKQITINPQPQPGFISPEVCLSDAFAQFVDTSKIASGTIISWAWNFGDPGSGAMNTSTLQNPQHRYTAVGNYTVTLTVTSNNGCIGILPQSITVNGDIPVSNFNPLNPAAFCANDSIAIQDASSVNFGSITKVEIYWDNSGSPAIFELDNNPFPGKIYRHLYPNFQSPLTKTFNIRYRAYSGATCVNDRVKSITVNAAPKVQFTSIPDICLYANPYQITQASETGGVPGTFQFTGAGVNATGLFTPATAGPRVHTIKYTFTSNYGCIDTASRTVNVLSPPVANFAFSSPTCETHDVTFTDSSTSPSTGITSWSWDFGDGTAIVVRNTAAAFTHQFTTAGTFNVKLTVTNGEGCTSLATVKPVKINPNPVVNFSLPKVCLPNASAQFSDLSSISDGTSSLFTYSWNFGDPASGAANLSTQKNPVHIYTSAGPYAVTLEVTSGNGCTTSLTKQYNDIHPVPVAKFISNKTEVCEKDAILFTDQSNGTDTTLQSWLWKFGDGTTSTLQNPAHTFNIPGKFNVSLTVTNNNGCVSSPFQSIVQIDAYPIVNAGPDLNVLEGGTAQLNPTISGTNLQYLWTPSLYLNNSTIKNPVVTGVADQLYTLLVTAAGGCSASDQVLVKVLKFPKIPNTFSPNGDGINETWVIQYLETYPGNRVQIFTRYGQLVFESIGYTKPWDGTMKGKSLPFGTYYYVIEPGNGRKPITGYVTILK